MEKIFESFSEFLNETKMSQKELIQWYTDRLEKVKKHWNGNDERSKEYIAFAEKELEEVKKGRDW